MGYSLHAELFGSYAVGLMVIALRLFVRWSSGSHNFYWDDLCLGSVVVSEKKKKKNDLCLSAAVQHS